MLIRFFSSLVVSIALSSSTALASLVLLGPDRLLSMSDLVSIVRLPVSAEPGQVTTVRVLKTVKGEAPSDSLSVFYPQPNMEEMWAHVPPRKDTVLLAFLKKRPDGTFVAATAVWRARSLVDGKEVEKEYFYSGGGNQCLKLIKDEGDVNRVAELFSQFLQWDDLNASQRSKLLKALLTGPEVMRSITLDWLTIDRRIDFEKPEEVSDDLVEGVLANLHSPNRLIRQEARVALNLAVWSRRSLVPYIIDALDDPDTRLWAVTVLDGRAGVGIGPRLDPDQPLEKKTAVLKDWWARTGSKNPEFQRFIPKSASQPQPGATVRPRADGGLPLSRPAVTSATWIELATTRAATQPATRPTTAPAAAAGR